jgi:hypothetical protein
MLIPSFLLQEVVTGERLGCQESLIRRIGIRNEGPHILQGAPEWFCSLGKPFGTFPLHARKSDDV